MNGSEKVLIAQERMANNQVYVFRKAQPSKYSFQCECRSVSESGTRNVSSMSIKMLARSGGKGGQVPAPALPALPCLLSEADAASGCRAMRGSPESRPGPLSHQTLG